jgi:hypothetical protein
MITLAPDNTITYTEIIYHHILTIEKEATTGKLPWYFYNIGIC